MGKKTDIQWADSTVNPTSGCDGCELWNKQIGVRECYAGTIHERFAPSKAYPGPFEQVDLHPGRMAKAAAWPNLTGTERPGKSWLDGMPRVIFLGDMADVLSRDVPNGYLIREVIEVVSSAAGRRHIWMMLTKLAPRLASFARGLGSTPYYWPDNLWAGVSVTGRATKARIDHLRLVPAAVRFVSAEPLREDLGELDLSGIHLIIAGGASGRDARPCDLAWLRSLRDQCRAAGVAFFLKQLGANPYRERYSEALGHTEVLPIDLRDSHGGDWTEWPEDLRIRELPGPAPYLIPASAATTEGDLR